MLQAAEVRERLLRALDVPAGATSDFDQNGSVPAAGWPCRASSPTKPGGFRAPIRTGSNSRRP